MFWAARNKFGHPKTTCHSPDGSGGDFLQSRKSVPDYKEPKTYNMADEKRTKRKKTAGRKPKKDPAVFRYSIKFTSEENGRFEILFQKSGLRYRARYIKMKALDEASKVIKIDPATTDFYIRLTNFYHQFQAIGNNYNQVVKAVKTNFGDKRAFVLLRKLEKETVELVIVSRQIVALINEYKEKYLNTHLPD